MPHVRGSLALDEHEMELQRLNCDETTFRYSSEGERCGSMRHDSESCYACLFGRAQKRFAKLFRRNLPTVCIDTSFHGGDIFLAVIGWPVPDQDIRGIAERPDDLMRGRAAQS